MMNEASGPVNTTTFPSRKSTDLSESPDSAERRDRPGRRGSRAPAMSFSPLRPGFGGRRQPAVNRSWRCWTTAQCSAWGLNRMISASTPTLTECPGGQ